MNYLFSPPFSLLQAPKELHTDQDSLGPALDKEPSKLYARKSILDHGSVFDYIKQIRYRWGKLQGALFKTRAWSYSMLAWVCTMQHMALYLFPLNTVSLVTRPAGCLKAREVHSSSARNDLAHGGSDKGEYVEDVKLSSLLFTSILSNWRPAYWVVEGTKVTPVVSSAMLVEQFPIFPVWKHCSWASLTSQFNNIDREFILDAPLKWLAVIVKAAITINLFTYLKDAKVFGGQWTWVWRSGVDGWQWETRIDSSREICFQSSFGERWSVILLICPLQNHSSW